MSVPAVFAPYAGCVVPLHRLRCAAPSLSLHVARYRTQWKERSLVTDAQPTPTQKVTVTDIDMPFGSMVVFMVKWALAAIPAMLILLVLGLVLVTFLQGFARGLVGGTASTASGGAGDTVAAYEHDFAEWEKDCRGAVGIERTDRRCDERKAALDRRDATLSK